MATVPNSAPANPYQSMAAMQPPKPEQNSLADAYRLIVETIAKMDKLAPESGPEWEAAAQSLKAGVEKALGGKKSPSPAPPESQPTTPPPEGAK